MKVLSKKILNIINLKNLIKQTYSSNKAIYYKIQKYSFSGCNTGCGCHSNNSNNNTSENEKYEEEMEKKFKSMNYKIIQCINTGKYDDGLELSEDFIKKIKEYYSKIKF